MKVPQRPDTEALREWMAQCMAGVEAGDAPALAAALGELRRRLLEAAEAGFGRDECGVPCSRFLCAACDDVVARAIEGLGADPARPGTAWVATGGYGRGQMCPGSTVRLLLLHEGRDPAPPAALAAEVAEVLRRAGWRAAAVARTVGEAVDLMAEDSVAALSMLQTRLVAGERALYAQFAEAVQQRFLAECWGSFGEEVLTEALSRRDPLTSSPYCTEPNLRDGAGCLRDIGTARMVDAAVAAAPDGPGEGLLSAEELEAFGEATDFVLRARNRLHFALGDGSDVLQRAAQPLVARHLGFGGAEEGRAAAELMKALFAHTVPVARLLRALRERFVHVHRVAWRRSAAPGRRELGEGFVEVDGLIYSGSEPAFAPGEDAARLMSLFRLSQRRHLPVSQELLGQVADHLELVDEEFGGDPQVGREFMDLLAGSVGVAERIGWMRDCGLLQSYLPELAALVHAIDPERARDHTLDEHAVEALRVVDELGHTAERSELAQRHALEQVGRPELLRLALLLHDVEAPGPAGLAAEVGERIGLDRAGRDELAFLLENAETLWNAARQDAPDAPDALCRRIGGAGRLRTLYLLSYAHARAAGPLGWFGWRDAGLFELYQTLMARLLPHYAPVATAAYFEREFAELAQQAGREEEAQEFLRRLPDLYKNEVAPADALEHLELLERTRTEPAAMAWDVGEHDAAVWVCTSDVPARFSQIAAVFTYNDLDIESATAFTLADGTVLDRFTVRAGAGPINPDPACWQGVERDLIESLRGGLDVTGAVRERTEAARGEAGFSSRRTLTGIHYEREPGGRFTVLNVVARDRPGLLFDLAATLGALGMNIELARVRTRGNLAQDVFFLSDAETGGPVTDSARLEAARERLTEAAGGGR